MRIASLFAGIGGLERGLELALGARTVLQCELEPFPRAVLARHWPDALRHDDVRTLHLAPGEADILCGGFPCQPWSNAGRRLGAEDERHLWPEFARLIREARPAWVVGENVSALLSGGASEPFADLTAAGYDLAWDCVPASSVGAPHRRDRVFILAWRRDVCRPPLRASERAFAAGIARVLAQGAAWPAGRWPTPTAQDSKSSGSAGYVATATHSPGVTLTDAVVRAPALWPSRPGEPQYAWEPPRTARDVPDRAKRLKALGNAVVVPVAEAVGHALAGIRDATGDDEPASVIARFDGRAFLPPQIGLFGSEPVAKWPRAGTIRNGVACELTPAAPLTAGADWPTPCAADGERGSETMMRGNPTLLGAARGRDWPSPTARDGDSGPGLAASAEGSANLRTAVRDWPTPRAMPGNFSRVDGKVYETSLQSMARRGLLDWPTPRAEHDSGRHRGTPDTLHSAVKDWPTPTARDHKDTGDLSTVNARPDRPPDLLPRVVQAVGEGTAPLSPAWVEMLIGLPVGWTELRAAPEPA